MQKIQTQGVHHITLIGADRQTSIDFWEGVLGMPFVFEQPNLDDPSESHLYFDPGDGTLITIFASEDRRPDRSPVPEAIGSLHHLAFNVSLATYERAMRNLDDRGVQHSGRVDRGFMWSCYFRDPLGLRLELACYKFELPPGVLPSRMMFEAHQIRVAAGDDHIDERHLALALEKVVREDAPSLSEDRAAKNPYKRT
ncbi:MAG: VOC family protein [Acidobacteria bacterium]|nr:MAG: VOC family protein [Acidobacteriota bacterium]REK10587.1 MAG: VOC family protein [Acidobacteriota bacterium]